jgi:LacI family transcriptional regulator
VRQVIEELGYVPSARAVGLARGRTQTVGMLLPSLTWPWIGDVLQGVADVLESASYGLLLFTCTRGEDSIRQFTTQVSARSIDGLIVIMPEGTVEQIIDLHEHGLPVVMLDDRENRSQFTSVCATNRDGAAAAARHLIDLDRRRPLVVTGVPEFECTRERLAGFVETYADAGLPLDPELIVPGAFTIRTGRDQVRRAVQEGRFFDAVFAHNDLMAMGALDALREEGLGVPEDVAVIGFDDIRTAEHSDPPLTSVRQPRHEMGEAAARLILDHLAGRPLDGTAVSIATELVVRQSTTKQ